MYYSSRILHVKQLQMAFCSGLVLCEMKNWKLYDQQRPAWGQTESKIQICRLADRILSVWDNSDQQHLNICVWQTDGQRDRWAEASSRSTRSHVVSKAFFLFYFHFSLDLDRHGSVLSPNEREQQSQSNLWGRVQTDGSSLSQTFFRTRFKTERGLQKNSAFAAEQHVWCSLLIT